ncbi:MAG TPA: hypothetical protein VE268_01830 [Herpetosiphonaceae bacterium]|nr:hypothetical protein [Herpetosiphonaceae bacterium]
MQLARIAIQIVELAVALHVEEQLPAAHAHHLQVAALRHAVQFVELGAIVGKMQRRALVLAVGQASKAEFGIDAPKLVASVALAGEQRPETATLYAIRDLRAGSFAQGGHDVDQGDEFIAGIRLRQDARAAKKERDAHQTLRQPDPFALQAIIGGIIAMIGRKDDDGVIG